MGMTLNEYMAEAIDGHQTGIRFLQFRTDRLGLDKAQDIIRAIGPYNGFVPGLVNEVLRQIADRYGIKLEVGREFSPCLYVYPHDRTVMGEIMEMLDKAKPDELDIAEFGYSIRAWWD